MSKTAEDKFSFEISLSVLDHLGRNLYRSFVTVLGEAISNSWDADAQNVWIYVDRDKDNFLIKDDGMGMTGSDFQNKFLKIGYSKRKDASKSVKDRPFIGRKGIGKLALLSCANKITVISRTENGEYHGGVIDNTGLNQAIKDDLTPNQYQLGGWTEAVFGGYLKGHEHGTLIYFEGINEGIKNSLDYLKKTIALYFRFSLLDSSFNIYINDELVTHESLKDLVKKTEFLWKINSYKDPFIENLEENFIKEKNETKQLALEGTVKGFIASVEKPSDLKVTAEERVGVDLFVNGRLREKDILKHIPTARVAESYLYGQIHYDELDDEEDRFTSSRESIVAEDPKYKKLLDDLRANVIKVILEDWDNWRRKHKEDGDPDNPTLTKKERRAEELFNEVSKEYELPKSSENKLKVDEWVNSLSDDARYNFTSYAECFISENLVRQFIDKNKVTLSKEANEEIIKWKEKETTNKGKGNISIAIRKNNQDISYLSMDGLAYLVDKKDPNKEACLARDANEYKPVRDALMHTALLTDEAKGKLTSVYSNIKNRINTLLSGGKN